MDLRELLLGNCYQFSPDKPAPLADLARLIAGAPVPLPDEYLGLFTLTDGGEGNISGYPSYIRLWQARLVLPNNRDYQVAKWLPGFFGIGDNGGGDMIGFDLRAGPPYPVCTIPFAPMEWQQAMGEMPDFSAFIMQLLPKLMKNEQGA